jgi:mannose-1-phosphate guanylyltransferase
VWTFTEGEGDLILDDEVIRVHRGDVAVIKAGMKHAIKAIDGELHIIEVQIGDELTEDDIERIDWDW